MNADPRKGRTLAARLQALRDRHGRLEAEIAAEQSRPLPDTARLGAKKRAKLRIKDEIASLDGVIRTLSRHRGPQAG